MCVWCVAICAIVARTADADAAADAVSRVDNGGSFAFKLRLGERGIFPVWWPLLFPAASLTYLLAWY